MEKSVENDFAVSTGLRYVRRQIGRAPGRGGLALIIAAVLLFGLCYLQNSIVSNEREMDCLYNTIEVTGRILPRDTSQDSYHNGFLSYGIPDLMRETGFIKDMTLESAEHFALRPRDTNGSDADEECNVVVYGVSDISRTLSNTSRPATVSFFQGEDETTFHQIHRSDGGEGCYEILVSPEVCQKLHISPGDYITLSSIEVRGTFYVSGVFTGIANALVPMEGLDAMYTRLKMEPTYRYTRCEFTIDPAKNSSIHEFREMSETMLEEDRQARENRGVTVDEVFFILQDSELTQAIQPLEKNLSLMRLLYPITQAVAALISAALAMLLLAQRAKDTAILRVLGISCGQTRWMLGVEPVLAALLGVGLGVLAAFLILGRQALGTSCLISLGLYLAGCLLGTILGTVRAVNRKPLELLQVKE